MSKLNLLILLWEKLLKNKQKQLKTKERALLKEREMIYKAFESGIFLKPEELKQSKGLKILTPKQMLQRLPIVLAKIKAGNNLESILNKIRQIAYYFYQSKKITEKVDNNIIKLIKV